MVALWEKINVRGIFSKTKGKKMIIYMEILGSTVREADATY